MKVLSLFSLFTFSYAQIMTDASIILNEGNICGGMMPANMISSCGSNLECVYSLGPMIADAPGFCRPTCPTVRDQWGNCVPDNCEVWNNGCNSCSYDNDIKSLVSCTEEVCYTVKHEPSCERYSTDVNGFFHCSQSVDVLSQLNSVCCTSGDMCLSGFPDRCSPECASLVNLVFTNCAPVLNLGDITDKSGFREFHQKCLDTSNSGGAKDIPVNCALWYDGCNTCSVSNGDINFCSRRMCLTMGEQSCREHHDNVTVSHETSATCFDGIDNDGDGLSDCDDPDCSIYGRCRRTTDSEEGRECFDGIDNDGDGLTDCEDNDCLRDPRASRRCGDNIIRPLAMPPVPGAPVSGEPIDPTNGGH